jgi:crotonobetainyl-CoA:carnitine CoA-transferase CaiB-like acyl-CoA transferase
MTGTRIIDLSRVLAGPWATQQLADQGADVIKVEAPGGDESRRFEPIVDGRSTYFMALNRNKRSIVLDLKTDAGREILRRLVASADVLVENFRPGVAEALGLSWPELAAENPRLIYVAIRAYGESDSGWHARPGYDLVLQSVGGAASFNGHPDSPPVRAGLPAADLFTGYDTVKAVLLALLHRERTGEGQRVVVNMLQTQGAALVYHASRCAITGESEVKRGNAHRGLMPYDLYPCLDGWLAVACGNDGMWQRLRGALDLPDRAEWRTNGGRLANREALDHQMREVLGAMTVSEADARLAHANVPSGPVNDVASTLEHPALHRITVEDDVLGAVALPGPSVQLRATRARHETPPTLAADRDDVLGDLGYAAPQIDALRERGAFGR